jgi:methylmalonyl-CoA mutase C-terminal domain/subunit
MIKDEIPIRVLMGKVGLDGHDRGAKVVMSALRDAGMEVIYTGLHQTPQSLVRAAVEEDVKLIGISILSGAHNTLIPKVLAEMKKEGIGELPIFVGGIIPDGDVPLLKKAGVQQVFTPGTRLDDIVSWVRKAANEKIKRVAAKTSKKKIPKKIKKARAK